MKNNIALCLGALALSVVSMAAEYDNGILNVGISLDTDKEYQVMENFGASDCWTFQFLGKNWPLETRELVADLLFSKEMDRKGNPKGIGLSMWRFNIGAGSADSPDNKIVNPWRTTECFADADGNYDFTGKQQGQVWFMKAARARGCEYLLGFCNSAPWFMTHTGQTYNSENKPHYIMDASRYPDFADFICNVWEGLRDIHGIELDYISPFNEPEWGWETPGQEGSPATVQEIGSFVRCLGGEFSRRGIPASIVFAESGAYEYLFKKGLNKTYAFFDKESPDYVGDVFGVENLMLGHSYWTSHKKMLVPTRKKVAEEMHKYGLRFWQSEYCIMSNDDEIGGGGGRDMTMKTALYVARLIHHDIVTAGASAWQWWTAVSPENYKDGLLFVDKDMSGTENLYVSKLFWVLGNYSRFVRPGAVRVEAVSFDENILVSAYRNADGSEVVVVQNPSDSSVSLSLSENKGPKYRCYITSDAEDDNLRFLGKERMDKMVLPARSVVTMVR